MTMQSSNLLPALRELPGGDESDQRRSFHENITGIVNMDRAMYAAEFAAGVSGGMWAIFDSVNVDDRLLEAYETRWPNMSEEGSLYDKVREMTESGELSDHNNWLYWGLKGKLAEFEAEDLLESRGFAEVQFAENEVNPGWDIKAIHPEGQEVLISIKTGVSNTQYENVVEALQETDYFFAVGTELHERISEEFSESAPELVERLIDIGSDYELVEGISDGLDTLSSNLGIDVPDGVGDIIPYAGAIIAGARLVHSVLKTEKEFKAADRTARNKIQVVQSLTLMSRIGITTTLATAGGAGGGALGSAVPGVGNLVGGIVGAVGGAGIGMYLNRHLQPHMLNLALNITGLSKDDLFYYKNKPRIDNVALNISQQARALAAPA